MIKVTSTITSVRVYEYIIPSRSGRFNSNHISFLRGLYGATQVGIRVDETLLMRTSRPLSIDALRITEARPA